MAEISLHSFNNFTHISGTMNSTMSNATGETSVWVDSSDDDEREIRGSRRVTKRRKVVIDSSSSEEEEEKNQDAKENVPPGDGKTDLISNEEQTLKVL